MKFCGDSNCLLGIGLSVGQALLISDFGPKTAMKIVDSLRKDILAGRLKSGPQIKVPVSFFSYFVREL